MKLKRKSKSHSINLTISFSTYKKTKTKMTNRQNGKRKYETRNEKEKFASDSFWNICVNFD